MSPVLETQQHLHKMFKSCLNQYVPELQDATIANKIADRGRALTVDAAARVASVVVVAVAFTAVTTAVAVILV